MTDKTHSFDYDYFVIGAGSGGIRSARIAAGLGAKVGVAEEKVIGGTCVNVGCVPKKLMAYAADYSDHFQDAKGYGWILNGAPKFDWKTFIQRKNNEIERLNGIYDGLLEKNGVDYIEGRASLVDKHTIKIADKTVTADKILIAVGGTPRKQDIPGSEHTVTSDEIFYLDEQPDHITIIGGGYVAVEFAHIFHGMGSHVTLCYRGNMFLRGFDDDMRLELVEEMRRAGIEIHFNCDLDSVEKDGDTLVAKTTSNHTIKTNCILSAIGREPNVTGLGLDTVGIKTEKCGSIIINDNYQTNIDNIFAVGDIANNWKLTPVATAEGQTLARRLFSSNSQDVVCYQNIATAIFSQPPIATVGFSEEQAIENGYDVECFKTRFRSMKFILAERQEFITMKLVVCKKTDKVLGCHMIGLDAPEIMQGFAVAMNAGATKADFDKTIGIHPTSAEEFVTMS